jgi:hypothetical protein
MNELEGHPEGWNSRGGGDAFGDVAAADYIPKTCGLEAVDRPSSTPQATPFSAFPPSARGGRL